jgi:hypothetical protein
VVGAAAAAVVRPILIPLVHVILEPAFVYTSAVAMLLAGIAACALFWYKVERPELVRLRTLQSEIRRLPLPKTRSRRNASKR